MGICTKSKCLKIERLSLFPHHYVYNYMFTTIKVFHLDTLFNIMDALFKNLLNVDVCFV